MKFAGKAIVGLGALFLSMPFVVAAMVCLMAGEESKADWLLDNSPITKWYDYLESN